MTGKQFKCSTLCQECLSWRYKIQFYHLFDNPCHTCRMLQNSCWSQQKRRKEVYHESSNIRVQILRSDYKRILEMLSEYQFNKKQRCNSLISADVCLVCGVWLSGQCLLIVTMLQLWYSDQTDPDRWSWGRVPKNMKKIKIFQFKVGQEKFSEEDIEGRAVWARTCIMENSIFFYFFKTLPDSVSTISVNIQSRLKVSPPQLLHSYGEVSIFCDSVISSFQFPCCSLASLTQFTDEHWG